MVELPATEDEVLELAVLGGHENDALPYLGVIELVVRRSVGGQLDEVVLDPLPLLHSVGLFKVDNAVLTTELSC